MKVSLLGCPHNHLSFPIITRERPPAVPDQPELPHVTCLDCGREFWYDWARMRRLAERPQPVYVPRRAA